VYEPWPFVQQLASQRGIPKIELNGFMSLKCFMEIEIELIVIEVIHKMAKRDTSLTKSQQNRDNITTKSQQNRDNITTKSQQNRDNIATKSWHHSNEIATKSGQNRE
jgi:hypothetical protein